MALGQEQTLGVENTVNTTVDKIELALTTIITKVSNAIPNLLLGLVLLFIGLFFVRTLLKIIDRRFESRNVDPSLRGFLRSVISFILYALLIITVISNVGIQTTSFIAVMSAVALGVGSALQGSLSNFAGGVLILILKPFKVGDYVSVNGDTVMGTVMEITMFYTKISSDDNKVVHIPNGTLADSNITNFTMMDKRRIDVSVGVAYESDLAKVKAVLTEVVESQELVLKEEPINVFVKELGDSAVEMGIRVWVKNQDFWPTKWKLTEEIKLALDKNNISIPYPQMDITVKKQ